MQKYNKERPFILNNYQCYRKDTPELVVCDPDRAARKGVFFAAKPWALTAFLYIFSL